MSAVISLSRQRAAGAPGRLLSALLLTSTAGFGAPAAAQEVRLAWNLAAGVDLTYRLSFENEAELPADMGSMTMNMEFTSKWSVLEVDGDGNAVVRTTTEHARMELDSPMLSARFDSDEPASGSPLDSMRALVGTQYTVVVGPRGNLVDIQGLDELREQLSASVSPQALAMLEQTFSEEALRSQWEQGLGQFPAEPVGVGSTWGHSLTVPIPQLGSATGELAFTVESIEGDMVIITNSGRLGAEGTASGGGAQMPAEVQGTFTGTSHFDARRGLLVSAESIVDQRVTMSMMGQEVRLESVGTVRHELVEDGGDPAPGGDPAAPAGARLPPG